MAHSYIIEVSAICKHATASIYPILNENGKNYTHSDASTSGNITDDPNYNSIFYDINQFGTNFSYHPPVPQLFITHNRINVC